jgi:hypothetical protein
MNNLFDIDTELTELVISDEGEPEEESEELEKMDLKEFKLSHDYLSSSYSVDDNLKVILNLFKLKGDISRETCKPPPEF